MVTKLNEEMAAAEQKDIKAKALANLAELKTPIWICQGCWDSVYLGGHEWHPMGLTPPDQCMNCLKKGVELHYIWKAGQTVKIRTDEQIKKERDTDRDAFELATRLETELLNPAGISIENPSENGQWVYLVVLTRKSDPLPNRYVATLKGIELLEKLKKGGLIL